MAVSNDEIKELIEGRFQSGNNGQPQRIVFWIDEKKEFIGDIENYAFDDITLIQLNGFNSFETKYRIEHENPESKFLIYVPYRLPPDEKNILADTVHYSKPFFCADRDSMLCDELGIPDLNKELVSKYAAFFKSAERRKKFIRLGLDCNERKDIILSMMCIATGSESYEFYNVLRKVLLDYAESLENESDSDSLATLDAFDLTDEFWNYCEEEYGIKERTLGGLVRTLFITYASEKMPFDNKKEFCQYISKKSNRVHVFVNSMYSDSKVADVAEYLSDYVYGKMKLIAEFIDTLDSKAIVESDAFRGIDTILISRSISLMVGSHKPMNSSDRAMIGRRLLLHYGNEFEHEYSLILWGSLFLEEIEHFQSSVIDGMSASQIIEQYVNRWYNVDRSYRKFIINMDNILEKTSEMESLIDYIENTYNNVFLNIVTSKLCSKISKYNDLPIPYQTEFYRRNISESKTTTVVIISDGLRYECATELQDMLSKNSKVRESPKLKHMVSTLPSLTRFGMAALLPNNGLQINGNERSVKIDGMSTEMPNRENVLRSFNPDSVAIKYTDLKDMKTLNLRAVCSGKHVMYVYHDRIDGPSHTDEKGVFESCERAFEEIIDMITRITSRLGYTRFIITSDHGFIYRRRNLEELDKISLLGADESGRRFAIAPSSTDYDRSVKIPLDYLHEENKDIATFSPDCSGVYKVQGAGLNYIHGGLSLQEIIVPVLEVTSKREKVETEYVGLKIFSKPTIKTKKVAINIGQDNPVSEKYREAQYKLYFEDEDHVKVSDVQMLLANKTDDQDMLFRVKFTMSIDNGKVHLIARNTNDEDSICLDEEYNVKIMLSDLGF